MLLSPFLSVGQAEIMMKLDHHAYKINVMNKNGRDRLGFECQFLFWYIATNGGRFLAHFDVGTPHGRTLHYTEQLYTIHMEEATVLRTKYRHHADEKRQAVKGVISTRTRAIVGHYHKGIKIYLKARVRFSKTRVLNRIKQRRKPTKVQQPEPSSEYEKRSLKLQQDKIIEPQEKRKAPRIGPRAQQSVPKKHKETIMKGEANANTKRMEGITSWKDA